MNEWLHIHFALAVVCSCVMAYEVHADDATQPNTAIEFRDFPAAINHARKHGQVTVVYFTAEWCGWCRKMEAESFAHEKVRELASGLSWTKIDIDSQQRLAAAFRINGVPALRFINARGGLLHGVDGYLPPDRLAELLRDYDDKAEAPGRYRSRVGELLNTTERLKAAKTGPARQQAVADAAALLADAQRHGRGEAKQQVLALREKAWPALVSLLTHQRLAVRAAAAELLRESTGAAIAYDPFADQEKRLAQASRWQAWVRSRRTEAPSTQPSP